MTLTPRALLLAAALAGPAPAPAATPPSGMMANVYRLTEAAAVLTVCAESEAYRQLPAERAARIDELRARLAAVVLAIGRHYRDDTMAATFEATRAKIAAETAMRGYVKTKYQYCGEALFADMAAYVETNEQLINGYFARQNAPPAPPARPAARP